MGGWQQGRISSPALGGKARPGGRVADASIGAMPPTAESASEKRSTVREMALFLQAFRLSLKAQHVQTDALDQVAAEMTSAGFLPRGVDVGEAVRAAGRACSRVGNWFQGLDSCLTRALVAGALLADRPEVFVHVGFRAPASGSFTDGHAWVSVEGEEVGVATPPDHAGPFVESRRLPMRRAGAGKAP